MSEHLHYKTRSTPEKAKKELGILHMLSQTDLQVWVPRPIITFPVVDTNVTTVFIDGYTPELADLDCDLMFQLGRLAKTVHGTEKHGSFGMLNSDLDVEQSAEHFVDFVERQIDRWLVWHRNNHDSTYVSAYGSWLKEQIQAARTYFDNRRPIFCHGDLDLKNVIVSSRVISGLVDWEHAGLFCLEWEMRKLSRYCHGQPELLEAFFRGYFESSIRDYSELEKAIRLMESVDLLGHLRWCLMRNSVKDCQDTILRMRQYFNERR